ncbi:hypothetical protein BJ878DRAFT_38877 [Calycina marina]|uniref:Uncharacterized protein n=1 Tax=Calycina marina TaxID=1763456 RepID=A0A9P7Z462_9HELO|nr:hypothetical protein BJ878DRAFT_38877 [Calycina marina]
MPSATHHISTATQEPPKPSHTSKDTGFLEPLSPDRNTTLPHPEADTSQNATIEGADSSLEKVHSRRSFRGHGRNHSSRSGKITLEDNLRYDNIQYADGTKAVSSPVTSTKEPAGEFVEVPSDVEEVNNEQSLDAEDGEGRMRCA